MKSLYLVPSRGRPHNALRLAQRFVDRDYTSPEAHVFFVIDEDDPELESYLDALAPFIHDRDPHVRVTANPRLGLGGSLNHWAPEFWDQYDAIGFMGDDHLPQTQSWDRMLSGLHGRISYGNDLLQGATLPTMVLMDSRIVKALGWFIPPGMRHLYLDNFWKEIGERTGTLRYVPEAVVEHLHPHAGKAPDDQGYADVNSEEIYSHDFAAYNQFKSSGEFEAAVNRVLALGYA